MIKMIAMSCDIHDTIVVKLLGHPDPVLSDENNEEAIQKLDDLFSNVTECGTTTSDRLFIWDHRQSVGKHFSILEEYLKQFDTGYKIVTIDVEKNICGEVDKYENNPFTMIMDSITHTAYNHPILTV